MITIDIKTPNSSSRIAINESISNLPLYISSKRTVIITDSNVGKLYRSYFPSPDVIEIGTGESIKTLQTVETIYNKLVELGIDRSCFIVGFGGGIVCDITGFVASTYLRGLSFGFVSTTLLSQVDASIGGKNGVNFQGYKNLIGVFNQPAFVICDPSTLHTLPERELLGGFGEIVKHAAIGNTDMFEFLEKNIDHALALDKNIIEHLVYDSLIIKSGIVEKDEKETGERRKLNFGHTIGHAIEKNGHFLHGEAISIGMVFAAYLSVRRNLLSKEEAFRIYRLLYRLGLPVEIDLNIDKDKIKDALGKDKKREGGYIHFVLLESIGKARVVEISIDELREVIDDDMHLFWKSGL